MGAIQGSGAFGFNMVVGNDGGAAALGVKAYALIDDEQVGASYGGPLNIQAGEHVDSVALQSFPA